MPKTTLRPTTLSFQPRPTFPYSPGTKGGQMIFTAGQVAWNEKGEVTGQGDVRFTDPANLEKCYLCSRGRRCDD